MKRASVSDVSLRAGVSTATVSRVLNSPERVAEQTRQRVLDAIEELNFVKSATAFSFKAQQTNNILVSVKNVGNIFYSEIFEGLQRRANAHGYNIIIKSPDLNDGDPIMENLRTGNVDGVISLDDYFPDPDEYAILTGTYQGTPPIVGFAEKSGYLPYPHIYINNRKAAHTITTHMIERGHTHIGHLPGPARTTAADERRAGFLDAMREAGLSVDPDDIYEEGGFHRDAGRRAARRVARRQILPTAVFCANDETAMGFISEMATLGIWVPDDISVAGFDNNAFADVFVPALTTIAQPRGEIGISAMDLLLDVIRDPAGNAHRVVELKTRLASRLSVARLRPTPTRAP